MKKSFIKKIIIFDEVEKLHQELNLESKDRYLDFKSIINEDLSEVR